MAQVLARIANTTTHTDELSVFELNPEGSAFLLGDVTLHGGATATTNAGQHTAFKADTGGYGMIRELIVIDGSGNKLYELREANRYARFVMERESQSRGRDIESEMVHHQSLQVLPTGLIARAGSNYNLTAAAATTPRVSLDLRKICGLFASGVIPLAKTGRLRIEIHWETRARMVLGNYANVTAWAPVRPQLTYTLLHDAAMAASTAGNEILRYIEPVLSINQTGTSGDVTLPLGGAGERVVSTLFAYVEDSNSHEVRALKRDATHNLNANGVQVFPQDLGQGSLIAELVKAYGPLGLPVGGYSALDGQDLVVNAGYANENGFFGHDLRPLKMAPGSPENSMQLDGNGLSLRLVRPTTADNYSLYCWMHQSRVVAV